jgi:hypothetical protein
MEIGYNKRKQHFIHHKIKEKTGKKSLEQMQPYASLKT